MQPSNSAIYCCPISPESYTIAANIFYDENMNWIEKKRGKYCTRQNLFLQIDLELKLSKWKFHDLIIP